MRVLGLCGVLLIGACASFGQPPIDALSDGIKLAEVTELPPPAGIDLSSPDRPYRIGPFDRLRIDVFGVEELSGQEVQADGGGRISFPLVGMVEAAGETPGNLATAIEARLKEKYVRHPQVSVSLEEAVSQVVTVDGEINAPGLYPVVGKMTLLRVIALAKGTAKPSRVNRVAIFREVDHQKMAAVYDLLAIHRGYYADPEVFPNDIVVVGDSQARRIFKGIKPASPLLTAPLIVLLKNR